MKHSSIAFLILCTIIASLLLTAAAKDPELVNAILSPGITVKFNGNVQIMKDVNGNPVYPIMVDGTTYLPVRAVCNMLDLPVEWDGDTKTVLLGATTNNCKSLLTVIDAGKKTVSGNPCRWVKTLFRDELPKPNDSGSITHSEAIKTESIYMSQETKTAYTLDARYKSLSFMIYNKAGYASTVQIYDAVTKDLLWSCDMEPGSSQYVPFVNISKAQQIELSAKLKGVPQNAEYYSNAIYICDPLVE